LGLRLLHRSPFLNFGEVVPGKIYRSAQIHTGDLEELVSKYGIKTIICLRGEEDSQVFKLAKKLRVNVVGIRLSAREPPATQEMALIMKILSGKADYPADYNFTAKQVWLKNPNEGIEGPYLIHCQMGADRTGYIIAVYRVCFEGVSTEAARLEMLRYNHLPIRYPQLWENLRNIQPDKFCPQMNPDYGIPRATKS